MSASGLERPHLCFVGWADHVHLERWAGYFAGQGYRVSLISFSDPGRYPEGVRQYRVGLEGRGPRWVIMKLRYLLWRIRPDIVHVHWAHFTPEVRAAWSGPLVVTAWGSDIYLRDRSSDTEWRQTSAALRTADLVTCDSNDLASAIESTMAVPAEKIEVIQWGVDTNLFSPGGPNLRDAYNLGNCPVVFSVRNFTPLYNQETVVAAFAALRIRVPNAFLLMKNYGGDADYLARIRHNIADRNLQDACRIVDTVPYEEMPALYRTADVIVSIPHSDATPMSLLEAMSSGTIPIVSDLPSLREWIRPKETGYLVRPNDMNSVAAAMEDALIGKPDQIRQIRAAARESVLLRASQDYFMGLMASRYRRAVPGHHPALLQ
jgi:glycosyltransferase involved in cell wall biosynthesis